MRDHVSSLLPAVVALLAAAMPLSSGPSGFDNVYKLPVGEQGTKQGQSKDPYHCDIFVSYCKEDKKYWDQIDKFLYDVHQEGYIFYSYRTIKPGGEIERDTASALLTSAVAILLMSQNYISSGLMKSEFLGLLDEAERNDKYILWIQIGEFRSRQAKRIERYQKVGGPDAQPLNQLRPSQRDTIYAGLTDVIMEKLGMF
jgi:hypothetical protein